MPVTDCGFNDHPDVLMHYGPTLYVKIGFDPNFRSGRRGQPNLPIDLLPALVDTGASESCIDSALAAKLNLPIVNRRDIAGSQGISTVNMHLAQIYVPSLRWTISGQFAGVHLTAGGQIHSALIGRNFLQNFTMIYEGRTGGVTLSNNPDHDRTEEPEV